MSRSDTRNSRTEREAYVKEATLTGLRPHPVRDGIFEYMCESECAWFPSDLLEPLSIDGIVVPRYIVTNHLLVLEKAGLVSRVDAGWRASPRALRRFRILSAATPEGCVIDVPTEASKWESTDD